jgi:hypothetical protein
MLKRTSVLDLCVRTGEHVGEKRMRKVRDAFNISDLPFRVEVVDWHDLSEEFRRLMRRTYSWFPMGPSVRNGDRSIADNAV